MLGRFKGERDSRAVTNGTKCTYKRPEIGFASLRIESMLNSVSQGDDDETVEFRFETSVSDAPWSDDWVLE